MFATNKITTCFLVFDVLRRADCDYVPASVIERVHGLTKAQLYDTLPVLTKHGILESKLGLHGGYKHAKPVSLYTLLKLFCPTVLPSADEHELDPKLSGFLTRTSDLWKRMVINNHKVVPLDYVISDETAEVYKI